MKIAAPHLANLLDFASTRGFDPDALKNSFLTNPGMDLSLVENSITEQELVAVVQGLLSLSGDDNFGLHYGYFMNLKAMGLIYNISRSATDIAQALSFLKDFLEKTFPFFKVNVQKKEQKTVISLQCTVKDKEVNRHLADASLTILYRELRLMAAKECEIDICFPVTSLALAEHKKLIGDEAKKGNEHALSFDSQTMNAALNKKNIQALAELLPHFLLVPEQKSEEENFAAQVRKMTLNMCTPELPEMEKVASQFCMSTRSFQRKLAEEGKPFRLLANEIKRDLSKYLQQSNRLKTQEIALLLGYSGSSAYLHAAKKWQLHSASE